MNCRAAPVLPVPAYEPAEVGLEPVDRPQIEAMCEAGYLPVSRYVELATALGWDRPDGDAPPAPKRLLPPMAQQPWRDLPTTSVT